MTPPSLGYRLDPYPPIRRIINDVLEAHRPLTWYGLYDVDVTEALARLRHYQRILKQGLSFHAYILYCYARVLAEQPHMQSYHFGRHLLTYEGVDISTIVEKRLPGNLRIPVSYIVRLADQKSFTEIHLELRRAMKSSLEDDPNVAKRRSLAHRPRWLRKWFWWRVDRNPVLFRRYRGTAGLTNLQAKGMDQPSYALPPNLNTCTVSINNIHARLVQHDDGRLERRQSLSLVNAVDHSMVDGAPSTHFCRRLGELIGSAAGLDDGLLEEFRRLDPRPDRREHP